MPFVVGAQVGPYRILEPLGQGGMAAVYKAYHAALDRYVALKVLHPALLEDPNFLARFRREARMVAKLDHPNIVPIYDFNEHEGRPYLVMKYIEGETLKARMKRGPLTPAEIRAVVQAVGNALAYAHRQGILHRDVKPSNVLLAQDGRIYLADFGLARMAQAGESTLSADMLMGTPQYISPEQAMGKKDLDARTDIYSFGVMIYEMVVGRVPYLADTPYSIIHDHIYAPLPRPRDLNPQVSEAVERVLLKALAKDPEDRFASVEDLVAAFLKAWETPPPPPPQETTQVPTKVVPLPTASPERTSEGVPTPPLSTPPLKPRRKRRWWWGLLAGAGLLLVCLGALAVVAHRQSTPRPSPTVRPRASATPPPRPSVSPSADWGIDPDDQEAVALVEAIRRDPDNPQPYLDLALLQYERHHPNRAELPFRRALALATRPPQPELLAEYALRFMEIGEPLPAARLLMTAGPLFPEDQRAAWSDTFRQAVYGAAEDPQFERYIPLSTLSKFDEPLAQIAYARYELYHGDPNRGMELLSQVLQAKGAMPEARLLEAEFALMHDQDPHRAQSILRDLLRQPVLPDWIRSGAEEMLNVLQTPSP